MTDREALRDAAEGHLRFGGGGDDLANGVLKLLGALTRAEAQSEARIARVQALIDRADHDGHTHVTASALQWAINGTVTSPAA